MKAYSDVTTLSFFILGVLVVKINSQKRDIGFLQTALDSALAHSGSLASSAEAYLKRFGETTEEATPENGKQTIASTETSNTDNGIISKIAETIKAAPLLDLSSLGSSAITNGTPSFFATKTAQGYMEELMKPVQKSGADIVEGAVKTGVDQAMSSITDTFKIDVALVVAVLVIQIVLFVCGAHLCFYVYQREREMRSYVKQQVNLSRTP